MYSKQPLEDAVKTALSILGEPADKGWTAQVKAALGEDLYNDYYAGLEIERQEAIYTLRAALGLPVPRLKCNVCGARDQIFWRRGDDVPDRKMSCHACGTVGPNGEWVEEPVGE